MKPMLINSTIGCAATGVGIGGAAGSVPGTVIGGAVGTIVAKSDGLYTVYIRVTHARCRYYSWNMVKNI